MNSKVSINDFTATLVQFAMDLQTIKIAFEKQRISSATAKNIIYDALTLQWYATQNYIAILCTAKRLNNLIPRIAKTFNDALFNFSYGSTLDGFIYGRLDGKETKTQVLLRMDEHRSAYDRVLSSSGGINISSHSFLHGIGTSFTTLSNLTNSYENFEITNAGTKIYSNCIKRCMTEFDNCDLDINS